MRRTLRSLGEGGWKGFGEFCKDTSELCSEELHWINLIEAAGSKLESQLAVSLLDWYNRNSHHTERNTAMAIRLNHTIVAAHDKETAAKFLSEILGAAGALAGRSVCGGAGERRHVAGLDVVTADGEITSQHYAFLVDRELNLTRSSSGFVRGGCRTGPIPVAASVTGSTPGTAGVGAISTTRTATCWKSSPVRMAAVAQRRPELIPCSRGHWILQITRTALTIKRRAAEARLAAAERSDTHERRRSLTSLLFTVLKS